MCLAPINYAFAEGYVDGSSSYDRAESAKLNDVSQTVLLELQITPTPVAFGVGVAGLYRTNKTIAFGVDTYVYKWIDSHVTGLIVLIRNDIMLFRFRKVLLWFSSGVGTIIERRPGSGGLMNEYHFGLNSGFIARIYFRSGCYFGTNVGGLYSFDGVDELGNKAIGVGFVPAVKICFGVELPVD